MFTKSNFLKKHHLHFYNINDEKFDLEYNMYVLKAHLKYLDYSFDKIRDEILNYFTSEWLVEVHKTNQDKMWEDFVDAASAILNMNKYKKLVNDLNSEEIGFLSNSIYTILLITIDSVKGSCKNEFN